MKKQFQQAVYLFDSTARKSLPSLAVIFLLSPFLEILGIGLIGVFLGKICTPTSKGMDVAFLQNIYFYLGEKNFIIFSGVMIVIAFCVKTVFALTMQKQIILFCKSYSLRLKSRLMQAYLYAPYHYHLQHNSAYLISRLQNNVDAYISNVVMGTMVFISSFSVASSILLFLFVVHPFATLSLLSIFALIFVFFDKYTKKKCAKVGQVLAGASGEIVQAIHHTMYGLGEIRLLNKEPYFLKKLTDLANLFGEASGALNIYQLIPRYIIENALVVFIVVISLGGMLMGYSIATVMATVGMFAAAGTKLMPTVNQLFTTTNQIRSNWSHLQLVYNDLKELDELNSHSSTYGLRQIHKRKLQFNEIKLDELSFNYPGTKYNALEKLSLSIKKGSSVGIIGPSGSGKSTLIHLILGFIDNYRGDFLVDGKQISNMRSWCNNFAYIPQRIFLLDDTIQRNIAFGVDDEEVNNDKLMMAIEMAQLNDVVELLPQGVNTYVGENGVRLSGGQRQRIALARAFYHERDIIVMDEATSALDNETEMEVINTIKRLKLKKTLIVIAHRLTTVQHCDVLYKLEKGRITQTGSYYEVVESATSG